MRAGDRYAAQNRRARHDYLIEDTLEAGLVLQGTEVKVLRTGQASIAEAYADERGGELFLVNANIPEYGSSSHFNHEPRRPRKLLLHRKEMNQLLGAIKREGVTIVPLSIYFNDRGRAKVELGPRPRQAQGRQAPGRPRPRLAAGQGQDHAEQRQRRVGRSGPDLRGVSSSRGDSRDRAMRSSPEPRDTTAPRQEKIVFMGSGFGLLPPRNDMVNSDERG